MPYGLPGEHNHNPELNRWMDNCVSKIEHKKQKNGKEYGKQSAIMICKTDLKRMNYNIAKASIAIDIKLGEL